ncbi:MAG: tetratricopeptide (TPR) repeat protein [Kiritimatiellia bacterium]
MDPEQVEQTVRELRRRVVEALHAGRFTKVRLSFGGRRICPDIPLAVVMAGEGVAFWFLSPLPALLLNLGARAILDVEFLHDADELVSEGLRHYLDGDLDKAEQAYRKALTRREDDPSALYNLGVLLHMSDRAEEGTRMWRGAAMGPPGHPDVVRASEALSERSKGKGTEK